MIYVDRDEIEAPRELESDRALKIMEEAAAFYNLSTKERSQRRFPFDKHIGWLKKAVMPVLMDLFHRKCAFCETRIGASGSPDLEQFRPKGGSVGLEGKRFPDHYWWLAFDWQNLYIACAACNRTKGNKFPVHDELRVSVNSAWDEIEKEPALLLDPCAGDPSIHLVFTEDGTVSSTHVDDLNEEELERYGEPSRGQVTIDTFGLNRSDLVRDRQHEAGQFLDDLHTAIAAAETYPEQLVEFNEKRLDRDTPYLQMKWQLLRTTLDSADLPPDLDLSFWDNKINISVPTAELSTKRDRAFAQQHIYEDAISSASVEDANDVNIQWARTSYIERVEIRGFTSMDEFDFAFSDPSSSSSGNASWLMLLGENGVGKTSVLKAISLALAGRRRLAELQDKQTMQDLSSLFHEDGSVRVYLTSQSEPLEIRRVGNSLEYSGDAQGAKSYIRAFGPSRWFTQPGAQPPETDDFVRIKSLFNPFVPLDPGQQFLLQLDPERWDDVAFGLKTLLQIPESGELTNTDEDIRISIPGANPKNLYELSSGYEAVIAMSMDLIALMFQRWNSLSDAEGIVLLDEIGSHLHPRWKMRIVDSLRRTFPRVQFVATTHEPLCLRGLLDGETLIMRRSEDIDPDEPGKIVATRPMQDISKLRVDELLTSRMFGLCSTLDPDVEEQFDRYYYLLSRHESGLSADEKIELDELGSTIGATGILGDTRRDQLIYRFIDEFIAKEPSILDEVERADMETETLESAAEFWSKIPDAKELDSL